MGKLTASQRAEIIARRLAGEKLHILATDYDVSEPAIHKIVKLTTPKKHIRRNDARLSDEDISNAIARRMIGESLKSIADSFNVSDALIHRLTNHAKPPEGWPRGKMSASQKHEAIQRRQNGETLQAIADRYGVSIAWIYKLTQHVRSKKK